MKKTFFRLSALVLALVMPDDVYKANLAAEAEAFLMEDAGLTANEVATLKAKLGQ